MAGLSETGTRDDASLIEPYVSSSNPRIRKAALLGLIRLDEEKAFGYALPYLASAHGSLRRVAIAFLAKRANSLVLDKARAIYAAGDTELKKSMLTLYSQIGGWPVLGDFVEAVTDEDATIQQLGWNYLRTWKSKAVNLFTKPGAEDRLWVKSRYAAAQQKSWVLEKDKQELWQAIAFYTGVTQGISVIGKLG
jgi:hypothetical protein